MAAELVELLAEGVVVGSQRLENGPDRFVGRRVEGNVGVFVGVDEDWEDDAADGFVVGFADGPSHSLDDVDLGAARVDEGDPVEGWHVDAFA